MTCIFIPSLNNVSFCKSFRIKLTCYFFGWAWKFEWKKKGNRNIKCFGFRIFFFGKKNNFFHNIQHFRKKIFLLKKNILPFFAKLQKVCVSQKWHIFDTPQKVQKIAHFRVFGRGGGGGSKTLKNGIFWTFWPKTPILPIYPFKKVSKIANFGPQKWDPKSILIISVSGLPRLPSLYCSKPGVKIDLVIVAYLPNGGGGLPGLNFAHFFQNLCTRTSQKCDFLGFSKNYIPPKTKKSLSFLPTLVVPRHFFFCFQTFKPAKKIACQLDSERLAKSTLLKIYG